MSVGLDIGTKTVKLVEVSQQGGNYILKSAGAIGFSGPTLESIQQEKDYKDIVETLKKLAHDAKLSSKSLSISIPESQSFTRLLKFPLLNEQEISAAVKWEAEEYIPIPIEEAIVEHVILERQEVGNPPQVLVLLIAVQKSLVEKYLKAVSLAGMNVIGVETELTAIARALAPEDRTSILIDFGAKSTDIAVAKNADVFFTRSFSVAGDAFTRAVAQSLGSEMIQAEEYKKTYGLLPQQLSGKVYNAMMPTFKAISEEVKKAMHFYKLEARGDNPSVAVITGGTAGVPGLVQSLASELGMEVLIGNPFAKLKLDNDSVKSLAGFHSLYAVATGLAMREQ